MGARYKYIYIKKKNILENSKYYIKISNLPQTNISFIRVLLFINKSQIFSQPQIYSQAVFYNFKILKKFEVTEEISIIQYCL